MTSGIGTLTILLEITVTITAPSAAVASIGNISIIAKGTVDLVGQQITAAVGSVLVWSEVPDAQSPNWGLVDDDQSGTWNDITETQTPDWNDLAA